MTVSAAAMSSTSPYLNPVFHEDYSPVPYDGAKIRNYGMDYTYKPLRTSGRTLKSYGSNAAQINMYGMQNTIRSVSIGSATNAGLRQMSSLSSSVRPVGASLNIDSEEQTVEMRKVNPNQPPADPFLPVGELPWLMMLVAVSVYAFFRGKRRRIVSND